MKKIILLLFIFPLLAFANHDYYPFSKPIDQKRFQALTTEFRCLVCQNQNIAESNAGLAEDLRGQIYQQITQGKSDQAIIHYLVQRYGDFILYRPPFDGYTLGLWLAPILFFLFGLCYLILYIHRSRRETNVNTL